MEEVSDTSAPAPRKRMMKVSVLRKTAWDFVEPELMFGAEIALDNQANLWTVYSRGFFSFCSIGRRAVKVYNVSCA